MSRWLVGVVVLLLSTSVAAQSARPPNDALEQRFRDEVAAASADAAAAYDQGNAARESGRFDDAVAAYQKAVELAPNIDHPHRRLCSALLALTRLEEAMTECETALSLDPESPYDKAALAGVLVTRKNYGDVTRGLRLAKEASDAMPNDEILLEWWCLSLLQSGSGYLDELRPCSRRLLALDPDGLGSNFMSALVAATDGDFDEARRRLRKAKAAGLDATTFDDLDRKIDDAEEASATFPRWARTLFWVGLWTIGIWLGLMVALLVAGLILSRSVLRTVSRATATAADAAGSEREQRLRKIYKAVLLLSGVYFYLSIPIMLVTIVAAGCGSVLLFMAMGMIPIKLVLLIGIIVFATIGAVLRSLFVRSDTKLPGEPVDVTKHPKLRSMLDEVAGAVGTRPVDVAYLTPGTDMAVTERSSLWASLRGKHTERSLIMGIGLFEGMTQLQLRSILAHEYGHFRNQDTAGGGFALAVRRSLFTLIIRLTASGAAGAYNPVWWFLRGFHRVYLGISQGASRLQEVLADRWAIQAYGSAGFIAGYRHVVARSVEFDHDVDATIKDVIDKGRPLPNLYHYERETKADTDTDLTEQIETEMRREPTAYDSHPSPRQRLDWAEQLSVTRPQQPDDDAPVWALFADRDELERAMTTQIRDRIFANHGVEIAAVATSNHASPLTEPR